MSSFAFSPIHPQPNDEAELLNIMRTPSSSGEHPNLVVPLFLGLPHQTNDMFNAENINESSTPSSPSQGRENIKSFGLAILLSPKLSAYKGATPSTHVVSIVRKNGLHLPANIGQDPNALGTLRTAVNDILTQIRSSIKKDLKGSKKDNHSIFTLATRVVGDSQCTVNVQLCACLALLRKFHTDASSFWDKVNAQLVLIRTTAGNDTRKISRAFANYLDKDRETYGNDEDYTIPEQSDAWQFDVDSAVDGTTDNIPGPAPANA